VAVIAWKLDLQLPPIKLTAAI